MPSQKRAWVAATLDTKLDEALYVCNLLCSLGSQALKNLFNSSCSYISGSSSVYRGQSFLPTNPRMPERSSDR